MGDRCSLCLLLAFVLVGPVRGGAGRTGGLFMIKNKCRDTVWVGTQGNVLLGEGGWELTPGGVVTISAPAGWQGRFWGRTGCQFDNYGRGRCETGDCGGLERCAGAGGEPPATLAEFSLGSTDFYDVSLVDGYNIQLSVAPSGGQGGGNQQGRLHCPPVGCNVDVNAVCPAPLRLQSARGSTLACRSACNAFLRPQFCCTGPYSSPSTCRATAFSRVFKHACPRAYSFAFDDPSSTFTCSAPSSYVVTFCG